MPRDLDSEQGGEYLRELADHIADYWSPQKAPDERHKALYWNQHSVAAPDTNKPGRTRRWKPVRMTSGEAAREIELIQSFYGQPATLGVHWIGEGNRVADKDEFGLNEIVNTLNPAIDSPRLTRNWQMVTLGRGISFIAGGRDYYWDFPQRPAGSTEEEWNKILREWRHMAPVPVIWLSLPAETTFPASFATLDDEVLSTMEMTWHELGDIFSDDEYGEIAPNKKDKAKWREKITLYIYSNRKYLTYGVKQDKGMWGRDKTAHILRSIPHGLDRSAIRIHPGKVSGVKEPGKYWLSAIHFSADHIEQADEQLTFAATAMKAAGAPHLVVWLNAQDTSGTGAQAKRDLINDLDLMVLDAGDVSANRAKEDVRGAFQPNLTDEPLALANKALDIAERLSGTNSAIEGNLDFSGPAWSANFAAEQAKAKAALLTQNVVHADVDDGESLIRALRAFKEPFTIPVGEDKEKSIVVDPKRLANFEVVLKGDYAPRVMMNKRADEQLAIAGMIQVAQNNLPFPPPDYFAEMLGIEQPFEAFKRNLKWKFLQSEEMIAALMQQIQQEADVEIARDEGMSIQEAQSKMAQLPEAAQAVLLQRLRGGNGAGPSRGGATGLGQGDANSLMKAASGFQRAPGGPDPTRALP